MTPSDYTLRRPDQSDAVDVHDLIGRCKPLDENSVYCNMLQCSHFSDTCVLAEKDGEIHGFISGYILPHSSNTLFIWQVAVDATARGHGLGKKMLLELLSRPQCRTVSWVHTTVGEDNDASWGMFASLAKELKTQIAQKPYFDRDRDFKGRHDSEFLAEIGPFKTYFI